MLKNAYFWSKWGGGGGCRVPDTEILARSVDECTESCFRNLNEDFNKSTSNITSDKDSASCFGGFFYKRKRLDDVQGIRIKDEQEDAYFLSLIPIL